jgi:hypothetical protein
MDSDIILEELAEDSAIHPEPANDDISSLALSGAPSLDPSVGPTLGQLDASSSPVDSLVEEEPVPSNVTLPERIVPTTPNDLPSSQPGDAVPLVSQSLVDDSSVASGESVAFVTDDVPFIPPEVDPSDGDTVAQQVNNFFNSDSPAEEFDSDLEIVQIVRHRCVEGILELGVVEYSSGAHEFHPIVFAQGGGSTCCR